MAGHARIAGKNGRVAGALDAIQAFFTRDPSSLSERVAQAVSDAQVTVCGSQTQ